MQNLIKRLDAHDIQIKELTLSLAGLSDRLSELGKQVDRLQIAASVDVADTVSETPERASTPEAPPQSLMETLTRAVPLSVSFETGAGRGNEVREGSFTPSQPEPSHEEQVAAGPGQPEPIVPQSEPLTESADEETEKEPEVVLVAPVPGTAGPSSKTVSLEQRLSTNWLVWVGGVALALAGIFLVRYIAEQGWLSPATRCAIGVILGLMLVIAGEVVRRRPIERAIAAIQADYVPQALTSGGLVTAFGSVYVAYAFYALIPSGWSFVLLGAIAVGAFLLSVVQGGFVALLGLVGAAITPALVSTEDPSAWGFFSYLGIIALAAMAVTDRRQWYWLAQLALLTMTGWSALWIQKALTAEDILPIGSIYGVVAMASLAVGLRAKSRPQEADLVAWFGLCVAAAVAMGVAVRLNFTPDTHWLILSYAIAAVAIARFAPRFNLSLPAMAVLSIAALGLSYVNETAIANILERALGVPAPTQYFVEKYDQFVTHATLIAIVLFAGGVLSLSRATRQMIIAVTTGAAPLVLLVIGYAQFRNYTGDVFWTKGAVLALIAATLTTSYLRRGQRERIEIQSVYAAFAVVAALLAATFQLDRIWLTLAYAGLVLVVTSVSARTDLPVLPRLVNLIVLTVLLRLTVNPDLRAYELVNPFGMQWVSYGYLVPLALFVTAARVFKRVRDDMTVTVLEGAALLLGIAFVSIEIRIYMTGSIYSGAYRLPEISLQTIFWLTSALVLARRNRLYPRFFSKWGSRLLTTAGAVQAVSLQLVAFNPVFTGDLIDGYGLFNILILSLLVPAILLWLIAGSLLPADQPEAQKDNFAIGPMFAFSALLAFAFVTEEVRVLFQGMVITPEHASLTELYVTTLAWILPASIPYLFLTSVRSPAIRTVALAVLLGAMLFAVLGHTINFNPVLTQEPVLGWPVFNILLLGFFLPAAVFHVAGTRLSDWPRQVLLAASYLLVFVGLWLTTKQAFQGARLIPLHESLRELYVTTLVWLLFSAALLRLPWARKLSDAETAGYSALAVSMVMLFVGHTLWFNPVVDGSYVRGWPLFNDLTLGFIAPSALLALISRWSMPKLQTLIQLAAYVLLFVGVTMLVKHAFQGGMMSLNTLTNIEDYAYSAVWLVLAIATLFGGIAYHATYARYASLAVLLLVVLKVFGFDMSGLEGLWRVASLFGLGICLIGIGWVYQRFVFSPGARARKGIATHSEAKEA